MAKPAPKHVSKDFNYQKDLAGMLLIGCSLLGLAGLFTEAIGKIGLFIQKSLGILVGDGYILLLALIFFSGLKLMRRDKWQLSARFCGLLLLFAALQIFLNRSVPTGSLLQTALAGEGGGLIGAGLGYLFLFGFGQVGTYILLGVLVILGITFCYGISPIELAIVVWYNLKTMPVRLWNSLVNFLFEEVDENANKAKKSAAPSAQSAAEPVTSPAASAPEAATMAAPAAEPLVETMAAQAPVSAPTISVAASVIAQNPVVDKPIPEMEPLVISDDAAMKHYHLPPLSLLNLSPKPADSNTGQNINSKVKTLEKTLENFGIKAHVTHVSVGPAITRYELQPPPGIKVSKIVGLADDIALSMATLGVRIEAPIPGKAAVGIEVPNEEIAPVFLRELLETNHFNQAVSQITVALGKDIAGAPVLADLSKMPHLLIAGATGSGKSVCVNTLICSILFKATPDKVKFLMVDPKMVELAHYNNIPHLVSPVVTDAKKAAGALRWAVREMESRYDLFADMGVRDITRYNEMLKELGDLTQGHAALPLIVVVIDELADLMMVAPADVEDSICRLAQMARAAGIHLVIATQRPSVDVITGLIKANIPSRLSFAVSSQTDSRTILDAGGAEKLLGKGDMLFYPVGAAKPLRVQGAYLSDQEVESLVDFLKDQARPDYNEEIGREELEEPTPETAKTDELLPQAIKIFIESGTASISMLQRRLRIGYSRAARLVDIMEQQKIIGGFEGSKPRTVLMTMEQYQQLFEQNQTQQNEVRHNPVAPNASGKHKTKRKEATQNEVQPTDTGENEVSANEERKTAVS